MFAYKLRKKAKHLVQISRLFSVGNTIPVLEQSEAFSEMNINENDWDFFTTVACLRYGIQCIPMDEISKRDFKTFYNCVLQNLSETDQQMIPAFDDLSSYFVSSADKLIESGLNPFAAMGMWVVMNLRKTAELTDKELVLSDFLTFALHSHLKDW